MTGRFITFEGGEGAGKSTQVRLLADRLKQAGKAVVTTREPGGSIRAESIRKLLLEGKAKRFGPFAEALLFSIARDDHLNTIIRPALEGGRWVISDRFMDSTTAYQGAGENLAPEVVRALERAVVSNTRPDVTILLDVPPEVGMGRAKARQKQSISDTDRFEEMNIEYHQRLRTAFLDIAKKEAERVVVFDGTVAPDVLAKEIWDTISNRLILNDKLSKRA